MSATAPVPRYLRSAQAVDVRRALAFAGIAGLHIAALATLFMVRTAQPAPPMSIRPMMVTFVSKTPPKIELPPPPPEPVKPKPRPKLIAAADPTPAPVTVPPDEPPDDTPPVEQTPPPPAPVAPAPVIPPDFVAAYLNNPGPRYPQMSVQMREQGTVMLLVLVDAQGRAEQVTVDASSGHPRLDAAAVDVVRNRWRFVAAKQGDRAVSAWVKVPITFELRKH